MVPHEGFLDKKTTETSNEVEQIYQEILFDLIEHEMGEIVANIPDESIVNNFHGTFLSNFYATPIVYNGNNYPSVEHAYLHQKFSQEKLQIIDQITQEEIVESMRAQGYGAEIQEVDRLFFDKTFNAYSIKKVVTILQKNGYGKESWSDEERIKTMIELLLNKFSDEKMNKLLVVTAPKVLIEGNNWQDTFWGYCDGQGKNILGRILMNIRERKNDR